MTKQKTTTISIYKEERKWIEDQKILPSEPIKDVVRRIRKQQDKIEAKVMTS